jgi:hypothetical protein|tara:strand:+ start:749 stop:1354 length:606 start_codon:yes stop_codon:yes gene_type:complete
MAYGSVKVDTIITSTQSLTVDNIPTGANGSVTNAQLAGSITDSKLNTISTAGKVSGGAITSGTIAGSTAISTSGQLSTSGKMSVGSTSVSSNTDLDVTGAYAGNKVTMSNTTVDCSTGNYFCHTAGSNTTYHFANVAPSGRSYAFTLEVYHTGGTLSWPSSVKWPGDSAPTLSTGKTHVFVFVTDDQGSRWRGVSAVDYVN